jgi:hypothetical protein
METAVEEEAEARAGEAEEEEAPPAARRGVRSSVAAGVE